MEKCILFIVLSFGFLTAKSQRTNRVMGTVVDSITLQPVSFSSISIVNKKQAPIKNVISDSLGKFSISNIAPGSYSLVVSAIGYKRSLINYLLITDTSAIDLGLHLLSPGGGLLAEVVVRSDKPVVSASVDGFVYNPENDLIAVGTNAADMLRKIPMLTIDQNGTPTLRGSSNIRVFIDDKPSDIYAPSVADALKQIPAEDIVKVEVILYPSAKYDAEGTDGVINIITRKSRFNAVNGTVRAQVGNLSRNFTPDINIRRGNWIFTSHPGIHFNNNLNGSTLTREDLVSNTKSQLEQQSESKSRRWIVYTGINIIYVINELHSLNGGYRYRVNRNNADRDVENRYYENDSLATAFTRHSDIVNGNDMHTLYAGYNGRSRDRKKQYSMLVFYFSSGGLDNYDMDQWRKGMIDYKERFRGDQENKEFSIQADYSQNISDNSTWDAGIKSMSRRFGTINDFEVYDFSTTSFFKDDVRSNQFNHHRDIYAAYSNISWRMRSWQMRMGARYEQTVLQTIFKGSTLSVPDYKNLVPSVVISKTLNEKQVIRWSYGKRITRPLAALNPAINYNDSFNIQSGNPYLQPEITNRYEMGYTWNSKQFFFMASFYYNRMRNGVELVRLPLSGGVFNNTYQNIGKNDVVGLSVSATWKWKQKLTATSTINLRQINLESQALQQSRTGFQYGGNCNISYVIGKGYNIDAMATISSDDINLQGKNEGWRFYALIINKKFKGDKVSMSWRMDNFFPPAHQYLTQTSASSAFNQVLRNRYQNHYYVFSISWKWGKKEVKAPVIRQEGGSVD